MHKCAIQRLLIVTRMACPWMVACTLCYPHFEITQLYCLSLEHNVAILSRLFGISLGLQAAQSFQCVVPYDCRPYIRRCIFPQCSPDSGSPASTVLSSRELYELGRDVNAVC